MPSTVVSNLAQRVSLRAILLYLLVAAGVIVVTGNVALVAGLAIAFLVVETPEVLTDALDVDDGWVTVAFAIILTVIGLAWLVAELRQPAALQTLWAPVVAVLGSLWLLLDARVDIISDQPRDSSNLADDLDPGAFLLRMLRINRIADTLESGPKSIPEIAAAADLTEPQVRAAIELASEDGPIVRVDDSSVDSATDNEQETAGDEIPRYALDTRQLGASGVGRMVVGGLTGLFHRLARPLRGPR
ncbi:MAG: hypothetical protein J07HN4v3_02902 [Halonotius sp. J07HN4]|nr:MAG: hypothetical protein J07HN4v3_02902 [Halonotius sp. J07HN4]